MRWLLRLDRTARLVILSLVLGVVGGAGAQLFLWLLHLGEALIYTPITGAHFLSVKSALALEQAPAYHLNWRIPLATTAGGLLAGFLVYTFAPEAEGHGTDAAVKAFHQTKGLIRARVPLVKTIASAITIGSGGSAGREGPTAQIAAGVGSILGKLLRLPEDERRYMVLMGMAAGLSAIFKSPLGTAIFSVEILYSGMAFEGAALLYCVIAAAVAYAITGAIEGWSPLFILPTEGFGAAGDLAWYGVLGVISGLVAALLPTVFYGIRDQFHKLHIPNHFKPALGGLVVGIIGIFLPEVLGGGYGYMQLALQGGTAIALWLLLLLALFKIVTLSLTIGSGGSGGVFAPSLYIGAMLGAALAMLLHMFGITSISSTGMAVVGMAAVFAGAARVPIATLVMVAEMTGGYHLIMPTMLAVALSYLVQFGLTRHAKYPTLYEAQVVAPIDSPAHLELYTQVAGDLLRHRDVRLDEDILASQLANQAGSVAGIRLGGTHERLYRMRLEAGSPLAGVQIRSLGINDLLILAILRSDRQIVPGGGTVLQVGDELVIAAVPHAMTVFREKAAPSSKPNATPP
ncbi:MAG: chloride channel protein [Gammaproteobacteria bacterium]|nr:chloride channel protein [Gammaproteobacteria bacterium]MDE2022918.1 chloride channel protein [Gammaproteobacteria bacterium]